MYTLYIYDDYGMMNQMIIIYYIIMPSDQNYIEHFFIDVILAWRVGQ